MNELRYQNHLSLESFDQATQERIAQSTITIFGIGGLGSVCSLYLTNAGVGKMNLVDYDTVDETNLPRQIIYKPNQVGMNKALAAKATLADFNPEVNIRAYDERMMGDDLQNIINEMTIQEKANLLTKDFKELWKDLWGDYYGVQYKTEEKNAHDKFYQIKEGIHLFDDNFFNLEQLIQNSNTSWTEPEWGFPKGRRNYNEND